MNDLAVRIVKLEPLRVASFHGFGPSPEHLAAEKLAAWAGPRGYLADPARHRIFGFNRPTRSDASRRPSVRSSESPSDDRCTPPCPDRR